MNNSIIYRPLTATPFKRNSFYTENPSSKELQSYIRCYWGTEKPLIQTENDDTPELVIPDTCVDIIYHIDYTDNTVTGGFCGINDCSFHAHNSGTIGHTVSTFAIRFYAWSAYAFSDDSLQSTINGYFDIGSRFEWLDKIICPRLLELKTLQEKISFTEQVLLKRLSDVRENAVVNDTIQNKKLSNMSSYRRDFILSLFLLKQYDQVKIISDTCERAIVLKHPTFAEDSILLWKIILCWGTGSNDIKLRDKASKGLTNLFRLYPLDMLTVINMFKDIDDDYIQERIWQAVYSSLIVLAEQKYVMPILEYIKNSIILVGIWPQNVLLRDYLRNIFEYAYYKGWCTEKEVNLVRPPYRSKKHKVNKKFALQFKDRFSSLFWNCQESDFAIYTIPSEVENYGVTKKDVGLMIFEDIVKSGYEPCINYDKSIDYTYGSLRSRDEQVERIGKKYQKIYLYRELGNIYDNYKYSPRFRYSDIELVCPEQGNSLRDIDLTVMPQSNNFIGTKLVYPFYRYCKWNDISWFKNNDVERYIPNLIGCNYEDEEYYMLQGYLSTEEVGKRHFVRYGCK